MSRINTNVSALVAQHNLQRANNDLQLRLERLSTGLAINHGSDNPSGLIVSERLRSEIAGVNQAISNSERASNVIATAEAALQEIASLLNDMKGLAVQAANTGAFSQDEVKANQLQIDSAIESITRISNTTSFAGLKLLNGSLDYLTSGINSANLKDVKINGANFGTATNIPVTVEVLNSAATAQLYISGNTTGAAGALLSSVTFEVQGTRGVDVLSFVSGTALSAVVFAVNQVKDATGVSASLRNAGGVQTSGMVLTSTTFGTDAFVSVRKISDGSFFRTFDKLAAMGAGPVATNRDVGEDVLALVNGNLALGRGTEITMHSSTLNIEMTLSNAAAQTFGTNTFTITGGGANYQIGPTVNSSNQIGFGIQSVAASHLGTEVVGFLSSVRTGGDNSLVAGEAGSASQVIDSAIDQISLLRGRLGAFERNTLQTAVRSSQIALENLTASESQIRDTDFASETANLNRAQILVNAGTSVLALANSTASQVLNLLQ